MAKILLDIYCSTNILKTGLLWLDIFSFLFKEQTSWNTKNLRKTPLRNAPWQQSHPWHRRHLDIEMKSDTRRHVVSVNWGLESPWNGPWLLRIQSPNRHEELFWGGTPFGWIATNSVYIEDNGRCDCRRGAKKQPMGSWSPKVTDPWFRHLKASRIPCQDCSLWGFYISFLSAKDLSSSPLRSHFATWCMVPYLLKLSFLESKKFM